ncbi:kinase-like domain-containing protein [Crucibulum laeve]|uniref:Kinase-like domain-containing protein n=1 Tax=Crucibulum laeve TaxID=68775 RepID=A0A5C3LVB5_9AGAR|nr:kinase-like domain-containing protein [Crucibulum laeve]
MNNNLTHVFLTFTRLSSSFQALLNRMASLSHLQSIIQHGELRLQLLKVATQIGLPEQPIRKAVQSDEMALMEFVKSTLSCMPDKEEMLSLKGDDATALLNLLQKMIARDVNDADTSRKARRLFIRLSQQADIILAPQLVSGLVLLNDGAPVSGGGYADIFRALYGDREVAVKRIRVHLNDKDPQKIRREFAKEAHLWYHLKHPYVLPFLGIDSELFTSSLSMVSPWMKHGTIMDFRTALGPSNINIEQRLFEIAEGLEYLHGEGVIHGDLRGGNVLIDDEWHAVLADFGLTIFSDATAATHETNPRGTCRWMAPELLIPELTDLNDIRKTEATDVYAFGCVCLELYTGMHPFSEAPNEASVIYQLIIGNRPSLAALDDLEDDLKAPAYIKTLVDGCLRRRDSERPGIAEVVIAMKSATREMEISS